ncbi:monovalent cation/H(+) antiporter subunit G [Oceanospirillaceae bacterium]|nr:monovalent cation/H(+) antiporter subunit G [Oceanospirillaceae bacterium]
MDTLLNLASSFCLLLGSFLCLSGGVGILRFPDFYTRMHAAGVSDTLAAAMILIGLMLQIPETLVIIKLIIILLMTLFISPSASHALGRSALLNGLTPVVAGDKNHAGQTTEVGDNPSKS